jgi:hypothetical protein
LRRESPAPGPFFVFGHGLSYTEFEYSNFCLDPKVDDELVVEVLVDIKKVSSRASKEVVQVYVDELLKAVAESLLESGTAETVFIVLDKYAFCEWDETELMSRQKGVWKVDFRKFMIEPRKDAETNICGGAWKAEDRELMCWRGS